MRYLILALLLTGCTQNQIGDLASAAAVPAYITAGQAVLDKPIPVEQLAALKAADNQAYATVTGLNVEQMRKVDEVHRRIQSLQ